MSDLLNQFWKLCEAKNHLSVYKGLVRRARPYRLDGDATELITELSSGETIIEKLAIYRRLARLPFDVVWIEFDFFDRFIVRQRLGTAPIGEVPEGTPDRIGFMLERLSDTEWRCLVVVSYPENRCDVFGSAFIVSTEGPVSFKSWIKNPDIKTAVTKLNNDNVGQLGWGIGTIPNHLENSVYVDLAPSYEPIVSWLQETKPFISFDDHVKDAVMQSLNEVKGDLRFLCAALAVINEVPITFTELKREGVQRIGGALKPFMVNRIVSINVPKKRGRTKKVMSMLRLAERQMRRHEVAGHWKTVIKGGVRERRWINNYERGDASLGYVHQLREVTSK